MAAQKPPRPIHGKLNNYERFLEMVYDLFNGGLDRGGFSLANSVNQPGHMDNLHMSTTTPNVANTTFSFTHNLGRIPTGINVVYKNASCDVFAAPGNPWTTTQIFLQCTQASIQIVVEIY